MITSALRVAGAVAAGLVVPYSMAVAAVLTFDITETASGLWVGNFTDVPQDYGDRISALSITSGANTYEYGGAEGLTPNIEVGYGPALSDIALWDNNYGDLQRVLYPDNDGVGLLEVTLTADPGYRVNLHGFDMGGWNRANRTIDFLEVEGDAGDLFAVADLTVAGAGPSHSDFDFATPLMARTMTIRFDSTNLGTFSDNVGMDNVIFSQSEAVVIPLPGAFSMLALALAGLGGIAWRRRDGLSE